MRLLLDQGLPRSAIRHLAALGIAAQHVGDLGLARASDTHILNAARERRAVVVTLDADFHTLLATSHATDPSVIRIRIERLDGHNVALLLAQVLQVAVRDIEAGAVVSVTAKRIRLRRLPIG